MKNNTRDSSSLVNAAMSDKGVIFDLENVFDGNNPSIEDDVCGDDLPLPTEHCPDNSEDSKLCRGMEEMEIDPLPFDITQFEFLKEEMIEINNFQIWKKVIRPGTGKSTPGDFFVVRIKYQAFLENQVTPYDSQSKRIRLDSNSMIYGLEMAVKSMVYEEISAFLIHPDAAYGKTGLYPAIPPNSYLLFRVEMMHFSPASPVDIYYDNSYEVRRNLPFEEIQTVIIDEKNEGNKCFCNKKYRSALRYYERAMKVLDERHQRNFYEEVHKKRLSLELYSNMALCNLRLHEYEACVVVCKSCFEIDKNYVKALYRCAKAFLAMGRREQGIKYLKKAMEVEPNNAQIGTDLIALEHDAKKRHAAECDFYRKGFGMESKEMKEKSSEDDKMVDSTFKDSAIDILNQLIEDSDCDDVVFDDFFTSAERYFVNVKAHEMDLKTERIGNSLKVSRKK